MWFEGQVNTSNGKGILKLDDLRLPGWWIMF
jgi:hypothetical protein